MTAAPCEGCKRFHRGQRCKPHDKRSVDVVVTMPRWLRDAFHARVPWGERSAFVARLLEKELG